MEREDGLYADSGGRSDTRHTWWNFLTASCCVAAAGNTTRPFTEPNRTEPNRTERTLNTGKDLQKGNPKQGESVDERSKGDGQSTVCLKWNESQYIFRYFRIISNEKIAKKMKCGKVTRNRTVRSEQSRWDRRVNSIARASHSRLSQLSRATVPGDSCFRFFARSANLFRTRKLPGVARQLAKAETGRCRFSSLDRNVRRDATGWVATTIGWNRTEVTRDETLRENYEAKLRNIGTTRQATWNESRGATFRNFIELLSNAVTR